MGDKCAVMSVGERVLQQALTWIDRECPDSSQLSRLLRKQMRVTS
jgi:hypothetical protein